MSEKFPEALSEVARLAVREGETLTTEQAAERVKPEAVAANTGRIYEWLAEQGLESDSVAREAVFEYAAVALEMSYEVFYEAWLAEKPVEVPASSMSAEQMLKAHQEVWDMPSLAEKHPEVVGWLSQRYDVVFPEDFTGQVYVITKATGEMEKMGTTDVREAVTMLLQRAIMAEVS